MSELVFFRRGEEVLRVQLNAVRTVIGRGERSDVVIPDPAVSRQQLALVREGEQVRFEDLSGSGTTISGSARSEGVLADGEDLELGQWRAVYRESGPPDPLLTEATRASERQTEVRGRHPDHQGRFRPAQLRIRHQETERFIRLNGEPFTVGKAPENEVAIEDRFLSARHLRVSRRDNHFRVTDLSSTNGVWIGGARLFEAEVPFHTTLTAGSVELVLEPAPEKGQEDAPPFHGIIGADPAIRQLTGVISKVAPSSAAVTILGESGTGKELVAQALHAASQRHARPFIPVNCAAISRELIESELFGHEKGAFTGALTVRRGAFEEADGGTLFLDEIGELPLELQAKLLRALESGEIKRVGAARPLHVDVRIVCATNRDLLARVREGQFREDLYYRLCVVPLHLPPLRRRTGDIRALAGTFLERFSPRGQQNAFTPAALARLEAHPWPGNIRELRNVVHRALLLRTGALIDAHDLTFDAEFSTEPVPAPVPYVPGEGLEVMLARVERQLVEAALARFNNNRERVAKELKVARSTLFKKLKDWGMTRQEDLVEPQL